MFSIILNEERTFQLITKKLQAKETVLCRNLEGGAKPLFLWGIGQKNRGHLLMITPGPQEAQELFNDLYQYDGETVLHFPAQEVMPHERIPADISLRRERQEVLESLVFSEQKYTVVTCIQALLQGIIPPAQFRNGGFKLVRGRAYDYSRFQDWLFASGYRREKQVETWGQYSQRGGIIDVFPLTFSNPVRIEFFDNEIDSIRFFDLATQRSLNEVELIFLKPAGEFFFDRAKLDWGQKKISGELKKITGELQCRGQAKEAEELQEKVHQDMERIRGGLLLEGLFQYLPYFFDGMASLLAYMEESPAIMVYPDRLAKRAHNFTLEMAETQTSLMEQGSILPSGYARCFFDMESLLPEIWHKNRGLLCLGQNIPLDWNSQPAVEVEVACGGVRNFAGRLDDFTKEIKKEMEDGYRVLVTMNSKAKCRKIGEYLQENKIQYVLHSAGAGVPAANTVNLYPATVREGFLLSEPGVVVHTEEEILGRQHYRKKRIQDLQEGVRISSLNELQPGDYVVHENHGIGIYMGVRTQNVLGVHQDYLVIKYAGEDRLYVPTHQVDLIQKYIGSEESPPRLYRLGGGDWNRVKKKVRESVQELAFGLLRLYAEREAVKGYSFSRDTVWQKEFEEAFPYEETPDQARAIEEIKTDMEDLRPMDRLLCGDVGYGKTEVAIRASFKAVMDGKQVAVLVPTTILAQQHYYTFMERFEDYPVHIEMLSRFRTPGQQKEIIGKLRREEIDIIIGTHRLLSSDIQFHDLGLLIIDEEQRFGVVHKERLKELKKNVDVLTLTATPIPRTLHMSLVGVRHMSIIETPPRDRYPIRTYVREYNRELIRAAIKRELARGGQVYFVHNRVQDIKERADEIRRLAPEANIAVAHGQMPEAQLEKLMLDFLNRRYDILVCTTIIETGMDIPNVNTIIVNNADHMGLAQLYQLRGRVGRSTRVAYAYLLYRSGKVLSEISEKRLVAIKEFTSLGSGFKLAMRDLEIRGAGNLLGPEQHGHIAAIGFSLYCKLLEETVQEMLGKKDDSVVEEVMVDADWDAYIPESYLPDTRQKIEIYKKIARIRNESDCSDLLDELIDRFGDPPPPVLNLLRVAKLRILAKDKGLREIRIKDGQAQILLSPDIPHLGDRIIALGEKYQRRIRVKGSRNPQLYVNFKDESKKQDILEDVLASL